MRTKASLLQTELLAGREQCNRVANAPFPGLRLLGRMNPHDEMTTVRRGKRLKVSPGSEVRLECVGNVGWQFRDGGMWRIAVSRGSLREAGRCNEASRLEFVPASPVDVRRRERFRRSAAPAHPARVQSCKLERIRAAAVRTSLALGSARCRSVKSTEIPPHLSLPRFPSPALQLSHDDHGASRVENGTHDE